MSDRRRLVARLGLIIVGSLLLVAPTATALGALGVLVAPLVGAALFLLGAWLLPFSFDR